MPKYGWRLAWGATFRLLTSTESVLLLESLKLRALEVFHAFTGCDCTSQLCGIDKKTEWQVWEINSQVTPALEHIVNSSLPAAECLLRTIPFTLLGENINENCEKRESKNVVLEMLHLCTPTTNKEHILESFQKEEGYIRILVATIAFGMGIDCKKVYRTIHFDQPRMLNAYMQEREGQAKTELGSTAYVSISRFAVDACRQKNERIHQVQGLYM
ncbi:hypothetical protein OS493_012342 [Desmophyllum pertusum]|uniref:DNA 3'-5' helicase n=1 Tax=Desmophyllum pertusum TaxID=174260 RepID=A0A9X0D5W2_9CNID|nr:hypothetical protein OS493_012342 [Desmophyllum pertusum]